MSWQQYQQEGGYQRWLLHHSSCPIQWGPRGFLLREELDIQGTNASFLMQRLNITRHCAADYKTSVNLCTSFCLSENSIGQSSSHLISESIAQRRQTDHTKVDKLTLIVSSVAACWLQITQLMEDKEALLRQQATLPAGLDKSQQKVLQMRGNVMNRLLKYANEAVLSVEDVKGMDEAAFIASLHNSDDTYQ